MSTYEITLRQALEVSVPGKTSDYSLLRDYFGLPEEKEPDRIEDFILYPHKPIRHDEGTIWRKVMDHYESLNYRHIRGEHPSCFERNGEFRHPFVTQRCDSSYIITVRDPDIGFVNP